MAATHEQGCSAQNESTEAADRSWYFSRKEIEEDSASRRDGISLAEENALRVVYSNFLQELGTEQFQLPEQTIATATLYCHRFFHVTSYKNDAGWTIAAGCMNMACRVESIELGSVEDLVRASYEILNRYRPIFRTMTQEKADERVKKVLTGDDLVAATLGSKGRRRVPHPEPLVFETARKFQGLLKNEFYQYARNIATETWLKTSLCLQYKPEHIAGAAIYLATQHQSFKDSIKYYYVGEDWWNEFDVPLEQLIDIGEHMLEEYENIQKPLSPEILGIFSEVTANLYKKELQGKPGHIFMSFQMSLITRKMIESMAGLEIESAVLRRGCSHHSWTS